MEGFTELLHKLREAHEREVEGWQVRVQELSNKKGCDTKRMEELFSKNQQMKEQQRLLTENIKTLENRLRAGLCDRCTVTQEVAKRRQQEFEASQIQNFQHITMLVGESNNLKRENKKLRDELRTVRAAFDRGRSEHPSNSATTTEVKPNGSPDLSPSPVALVTTATSRATNQPADGDMLIKNESNQRAEDGLSEHRQVRGWSRGHFDSYKPLAVTTPMSGPWRTEHIVTRGGERRTQNVEASDQRPPHPSQSLLLKNSSSSSTTGELNHSRHVLHAPVPCRPHPIKSGPVAVPWHLSEPSDWVTLTVVPTGSTTGSMVMPSSPKTNVPRFPNLIPPSQHANPSNNRRHVLGTSWPKQVNSQPPVKEPALVFRLKSLLEDGECQNKIQEKKEMSSSKPERASWEGLKEGCEGPLDLSDRGRTKTIHPQRNDVTLALQTGQKVEEVPERDIKTNPSAFVPVTSSPIIIASSSSTPQNTPSEEEGSSEHNHKLTSDKEQKEEVNGKMDQNNEKKVPVLTISLRPVVLESLNSALQKQESLSSNDKSSSPPAEPGSTSEDQDGDDSDSGQESKQSCKRKRVSVEIDTDRDSETDSFRRDRKFKITVRPEEKTGQHKKS
ncbi:uncharacterized protein rbbp8l isoform X2 [Thalassophryne amazonica]|uniref:uncharacterized protein rbbp8l isoform X2 n=1 Tax=Thalassophryne amazonica TaxID=390379 RepID=UPI0014714E1C|nr:uncharacterized protein rbbp8l isoform X2 [Thalassophryne amazonica]